MRWLPARRQIIQAVIYSCPPAVRRLRRWRGNGATGGMNYNRRSTRPDSLFYRETRKMRSPAGRGSRRIHPVALALLALALATFIWWFFKKP